MNDAIQPDLGQGVLYPAIFWALVATAIYLYVESLL